MPRIKMCGMMRPHDARAAVELGASAIGMILHANARRRIDRDTARFVVQSVPRDVKRVGVFVDAPADLVRSLVEFLGLDAVQLHGREPVEAIATLAPLPVYRVVQVTAETLEATLGEWSRRAASLPNLAGVLLDSGAGGSGVENDWDAIASALQRAGKLPFELVVAGGLHPGNVEMVVRRLHPDAVDVSSGIEERFGEKSLERMKQFVDAARRGAATPVHAS